MILMNKDSNEECSDDSDKENSSEEDSFEESIYINVDAFLKKTFFLTKVLLTLKTCYTQYLKPNTHNSNPITQAKKDMVLFCKLLLRIQVRKASAGRKAQNVLNFFNILNMLFTILIYCLQ